MAIAQLAYEGRTQQPQFDDAYISYRYARNLVEGNGLVFNLGERVEGYTNLLWTLLVAAGIALGNGAETTAHWLSLGAGVFALLATYWYASAGVRVPLRWIAALAPLLVLWSVAFPIWAFSGLETTLFTALVAATLASEARGRIGAATVTIILATLTRPEGALLAAVVFPLRWARSHSSEKRRVLAFASVYVAAVLALTAFRILYYGSPLPNTFFAKVGGTPWTLGLNYSHDFLLSGVAPLLIPAGWAAVHDRLCRVGAAWGAAMTLYIVWVGGDAFSGHRFWLPVLPAIATLAVRAAILQREQPNSARREILFWTCLVASVVWTLMAPALALLILGGLALAALAGAWGARPRLAVALLLLLIGAAVTYQPSGAVGETVKRLVSYRYATMIGSVRPRDSTMYTELRTRGYLVAQLTATARRIMRLHREEPIGLVASIAIGKIGYDTRLPILDLVGLTDARIAHSESKTHVGAGAFFMPGHARTDADYVLRRRPDYILIARAGTGGITLPAHWDLWEHPDFERLYEWDEKVLAYRLRSG